MLAKTYQRIVRERSYNHSRVMGGDSDEQTRKSIGLYNYPCV